VTIIYLLGGRAPPTKEKERKEPRETLVLFEKEFLIAILEGHSPLSQPDSKSADRTLKGTLKLVQSSLTLSTFMTLFQTQEQQRVI
jgi:hypothetical protein